MQNKNNDGDDDIGYKTTPDFLFFLKKLWNLPISDPPAQGGSWWQPF